MRFILSLLFLLCLGATRLPAGEDAAAWLDRAADSTLSLREREYAARQVMMLADPSASIVISALRGVGSDSGLRRQVAAGILGEMAVASAEGPLLEAAFGKDYFLAEAAAAALARLYSRRSDSEIYALLKRGEPGEGGVPGSEPGGEEDDWLALSLRAADTKARFRSLALRGLARKYAAGDQPLPEPLAAFVWEGLLDANADLRRSAVALVPRCGSSEASEKLAVFLYTESKPALLVDALRAMGEMRPPEYGEAVERHAAHDDPLVQVEALAALDAMGYAYTIFPPVPGARSVAAFVSHPSTPVRLRAIEILADTRNPEALEYLLAALFDRVGRNRAAAAAALGELGFPGAVGGLTPLLKDGRPEARMAAAVALAKFGVMGVTAGVLDDLQSGALPFRRAAAAALGKIGDPRVIPGLSAVLGDADVELACLAADSLAELRSPDAGRALFQAMTRTAHPMLSDAARRALTVIYEDDPGYTPSNWDSWARRNRFE